MQRLNLRTPVEKTHTTWEAFLPIRHTLLTTGSTTYDVEAAVDDLLRCSGGLSYRFDDTDVAMHFDISDPPDFFAAYKDVPLERYLRSHFRMLRVRSEAHHLVHYLYDPNTGNPSESASIEERAEVAKGMGAKALERAVFEAVIASNLARPGVLLPEGGALFVDGAMHERIPHWLNPIRVAIDETKEVEWPLVREIPFRKAYGWLLGVPDFRRGFATTALARSLAAFTYLFGESLDSDSPFGHGLWAILGLEAIYGEGTELVTRQLVAKTNAFLGTQTTHKNALKEMYSFRSRFLHGDTNFPYAHFRLVDDRFYEDCARPEWLAIRVLAVTLQRMADDGRYELSFRTAVDSPAPSSTRDA